LPGGKLYYWSRSIAILVFVAFMGLVGGAALFGGASAISPSAGPIAVLAYWGLLYLMLGTEVGHILRVQPVLKKRGGIPLKS
jgi:hypothetical protein